MEKPAGAQYAIQIAVHTLRDRCKNLQQRISVLEEENINLRIQCSRNEEKEHSLSEIDTLRAQMAELAEQKEQFQNKIKMVTSENQELWNKLGKLTQVNKNLGTQLNKINDTLTQHTSTPPSNQTPLVRSKTFTRDALQTKILQKNLEENDRISLELEDISLKMNDSFSKQKKEMDILCSEIAGIQFSDDLITENFGFCYDDELEDEQLDELKIVFEDLKRLKDEVLAQKMCIAKSLKNLENVKEKCKCKFSKKTRNNALNNRSTSTSDLPGVKTEEKSTEMPDEKIFLNKPPVNTSEKICPVCTKIFKKEIDFIVFQQHVEEHFLTDTFELV